MLRWYVVRSKPRSESLLCHQLRSRNIEVYGPRFRVQTPRSQLPKTKPCFPGYLFVRVDLDIIGISALQWIPGGSGLVSFGGEPAYVSDSILHAMRERIDQINAAGGEQLYGLKAGDEILINSGPFAEYRGIFAYYLSGRERAAVLLKFIRDEQIRVELPVTQLLLVRPALA